jgi:hypothetical protein
MTMALRSCPRNVLKQLMSLSKPVFEYLQLLGSWIVAVDCLLFTQGRSVYKYTFCSPLYLSSNHSVTTPQVNRSKKSILFLHALACPKSRYYGHMLQHFFASFYDNVPVNGCLNQIWRCWLLKH